MHYRQILYYLSLQWSPDMSWLYFPLQFKYWCLNPSSDYTEAETFKEVIQAKWAHKGGALILDLWSHRAGILIKEIPESLLSFPLPREDSWPCRSQEKTLIKNWTLLETWPCIFQSPHLRENKCLLFKHAVSGIVSRQPEQRKAAPLSQISLLL